VQQKIKTLLMFDGRWQVAMNFCVSLFPDAAVTNIRRCGSGGPGRGRIGQAGEFCHSGADLHGGR
jgi:predicted 3-demethylubiquinone-9 3-methyltransferase (glyoxalase superfamily)